MCKYTRDGKPKTVTQNGDEQRLLTDAAVAGKLVQLLDEGDIATLTEEVLALLRLPPSSVRYSYDGVLGWLITITARRISDQVGVVENGNVLAMTLCTPHGTTVPSSKVTPSMYALARVTTAVLVGEYAALRTFLAEVNRLADAVTKADILVDALLVLETVLNSPFPDLYEHMIFRPAA